jgi:hypothetical protein
MSQLRDLLEQSQFRTGLVTGCVAALALAAWWWALRERRREDVPPLRAGGAVFAVAALWSVAQDRSVPVAVVIGVAGVAVTVWIASSMFLPVAVHIAFALPFAWIVAFEGGLANSDVIRLSVVFAGSVGAALAARFDRAWRDDAPGPLLLALTAFGVYACVPDTEEAAAIVGVAVPIAVVGWPLRFVRLGPAGAAAAVMALSWVAAIGGRARPESVLGSVVCLGVLVGWPIGNALLGARPSWFRAARPAGAIAVVAIAHAAVVFVGARIAGNADSSWVVVPLVVAAGMAIATGAAINPPDEEMSERR